ncbi:hypothetical protein [Thermosulfurimonas sp. F29]|uniref:hypothetical protein n=1 Tax=Thermosulfurimonas sp. F29 TaxID=2867247 RepID=UPI001C83129A|nr:hypothetical protein [Thermosulfurimonas sp. F29]MBX6423412.1 hypothetical protein [Thermosulfurimonas sp. F29]
MRLSTSIRFVVAVVLLWLCLSFRVGLRGMEQSTVRAATGVTVPRFEVRGVLTVSLVTSCGEADSSNGSANGSAEEVVLYRRVYEESGSAGEFVLVPDGRHEFARIAVETVGGRARIHRLVLPGLVVENLAVGEDEDDDPCAHPEYYTPEELAALGCGADNETAERTVLDVCFSLTEAGSPPIRCLEASSDEARFEGESEGLTALVSGRGRLCFAPEVFEVWRWNDGAGHVETGGIGTDNTENGTETAAEIETRWIGERQGFEVRFHGSGEFAVGTEAAQGVLYWNGERWTTEPVYYELNDFDAFLPGPPLKGVLRVFTAGNHRLFLESRRSGRRYPFALNVPVGEGNETATGENSGDTNGTVRFTPDDVAEVWLKGILASKPESLFSDRRVLNFATGHVVVRLSGPWVMPVSRYGRVEGLLGFAYAVRSSNGTLNFEPVRVFCEGYNPGAVPKQVGEARLADGGDLVQAQVYVVYVPYEERCLRTLVLEYAYADNATDSGGGLLRLSRKRYPTARIGRNEGPVLDANGDLAWPGVFEVVSEEGHRVCAERCAPVVTAGRWVYVVPQDGVVRRFDLARRLVNVDGALVLVNGRGEVEFVWNGAYGNRLRLVNSDGYGAWVCGADGSADVRTPCDLQGGEIFDLRATREGVWGRLTVPLVPTYAPFWSFAAERSDVQVCVIGWNGTRLCGGLP